MNASLLCSTSAGNFFPPQRPLPHRYTAVMIMARLLSGVAVATFTSTISAGAEQAVRVGYAYANPPFASLPGGTPANYATLDPSGVMAQGAAIDLIRAIARDAGF